MDEQSTLTPREWELILAHRKEELKEESRKILALRRLRAAADFAEYIDKMGCDMLTRQEIKGMLRDGKGFGNVNLKNMNLKNLDFSGVNLVDSDMRGANLKGANLRGAGMQRASLIGANLKKANLTGAYLENAQLQEANLRGAKLEGVKLQGANLAGAKMPKRCSYFYINKFTILPKNFKVKPR